VDVTVVPSYRDSEKADITITVEQPDHTHDKNTFKDLPVIIRDDIPQASVRVGTPHGSVGVPTVGATEKGGKKEASHSYRQGPGRLARDEDDRSSRCPRPGKNGDLSPVVPA
jgi:hypothetical protein